MHILYIYQYFATPSGTTGTRSYEFARRWVAKGHKVTMLTSIANLTSEELTPAKGWLFKRTTIEGIDVLAMAIPYRQHMGVFKRCMSFLSFLILSSLIVLVIPKVDVIYATSTPLTIGIPALTAKWFRRKKYVFEVRDQWPESVVQVGVIKNRFVIRMLSRLEKCIYKNASAIVAVSDGMAEDIKKVTEPNKPIYVVPNGADLNLFKPDMDAGDIRNKNGWKGKLVFLHTGSMGKVNSLDFVIDVALKLKDTEDILFVLIGQGSHKKNLEDRIKKLGLKNVEITLPIPKKQLPPIIAAADVTIVVIGNVPIIEKQASLNKFYDGLAAGKPLLLNYYGWQGKLLEERNAGYGCKLCDVDEFVEKVLYFNNHREMLQAMGTNARNLAESRFDREKLAFQALSVIETVYA